MRKILITKSGKADVLKVVEAEIPRPKENELLIKVKAAGLNFADIMARQGLYMDAPPLPCTVGYEVSGVVELAGSKELQPWVGKEVAALTRFGGQSEHVCVPSAQVFEKPKNLSFEEAAAVPVNYLTAYGLMVVMGALKPSETILIHNAGGGVGIAALQIAKKLGVHTIGTASPGKHERLMKMGFDHMIDYTREDWDEKVMQIIGNVGVELVIDPRGSKSWKKSFKILRHTGRLGMYGASEASSSGMFRKLGLLKTAITMPWFHPMSLLNENRGVFGLNMGHLWHEPEMIASWMSVLEKGIADGWVKPVIDSVHKFDDVAKAHARLEERKNFGKVILIP